MAGPPKEIAVQARRDCQAVVTAYLTAEVDDDRSMDLYGDAVLRSIPPSRRLLVAQGLAVSLAQAINRLATCEDVDPIDLWRRVCSYNETDEP